MSRPLRLRVTNSTLYDLDVQALVTGTEGEPTELVTLVIKAGSELDLRMTDEQRDEKIARSYEKLAAARDLVRELEGELRELGEEPVE